MLKINIVEEVVIILFVGIFIGWLISPIIQMIHDAGWAIAEAVKSYFGVIIAKNNQKIREYNTDPEEQIIVPKVGFLREEDVNSNENV